MQRNKNIVATTRFTFKEGERLKRKKHIDTLFSQGKAYSVFPIIIKYLLVDEGDTETSVKAGFSVSKKKFKHAVKRNRVKRLMREAWRLQKHQLNNIPSGKQLHLFFIYTDNKITEFQNVKEAVLKCIEKLQIFSADYAKHTL